MRLFDITDRLKRLLPVLTDRFSKLSDTLTGTLDGTGNLTFTFTDANCLSVGDLVQLVGLRAKLPATVTVLSPDSVEVLTTECHDVTPDWTTDITLELADGTEVITTSFDVNSQTSLTFYSTGVGVDAVNLVGARLIVSNLLSAQDALTVSDITGTDVTVTGAESLQELDAGTEIDFKFSYGHRVFGGYDIDKYLKIYAQEYGRDQLVGVTAESLPLTAFVVLEPEIADKDRFISSDSVSNQNSASYIRQQLIHRFTIFVIGPNQDHSLSEDLVDICYEEVRNNLFSLLVGHNISSGFGTINPSSVSFLEHGSLVGNEAYYVHFYRFEFVGQYAPENSVQGQVEKLECSRSFKKLSLNITGRFCGDPQTPCFESMHDIT